MNLHDPAYLEGHAPPVLTAEQIYDDLRPRLLAWPEPVAQPDQPCGLGYVAFKVFGYACAAAAVGMMFFAMVAK
jgi:hypothetical protein